MAFFSLKNTDSALGSSNGLSERAVISLFEAPNGIIWIGTDGGGINAFNPKTEQFVHHTNTYNDKVSSITYFSPNELLVSLYGKGLFIYNILSRSYTPFLLIDEATDQQECHAGFTPFVYHIAKDKILITAKNTYLYNLQNKEFNKISFAEGLTPKNALQLKAQQGDTLFLSKGNVLYQMKLSEAKITRYLTLNEGYTISAVCNDKAHHTLWIATSNGLFSYAIPQKKLSAVGTDNMFHQISYMQLDTEQRLWINASNVLFSYHIPDKKIMIWDDSDGFLHNDMYSCCLPLTSIWEESEVL